MTKRAARRTTANEPTPRTMLAQLLVPDTFTHDLDTSQPVYGGLVAVSMCGKLVSIDSIAKPFERLTCQACRDVYDNEADASSH